MITFIRHAESVANAGQRTSNPAAISLTHKGQQQANMLSQTISSPPDLIIMSSYVRTQETAYPVQRKFPSVPSEIWDVHEWTYLSPGNCQNMTPAERRPLVEAFWRRNDPYYRDGGTAESWAMLIERAKKTLVRLETLPPEMERVLIFTHGQFIQMVWYLCLYPMIHITVETMSDWRQWMVEHPIQNTHVMSLEQMQRCRHEVY